MKLRKFQMIPPFHLLLLCSSILPLFSSAQSIITDAEYQGACARHKLRRFDGKHVLNIEDYKFDSITDDHFDGIPVALPHLDTVSEGGDVTCWGTLCRYSG
jgi:hypothetical protein